MTRGKYEGNYTAENVPNSFDNRAEKLAWYYVNQTNGNKREAYRLYMKSANPEWEPRENETDAKNAYNLFRYKDVQKYIEQFYEENRKLYANQRDKNIQALNQILEDPTVPRKDRISAIKELNNMFGYNSSTINVNGKANIEVEIV